MVNRHTDFGLDKDKIPGDGVVAGFGKINGRRVCVYVQDFTVMGGSFGEVAGQKVSHIMDLAMDAGVPVIGINDGGGARIQEGIYSLYAYGEVFFRNSQASGVVPQISVILGPCAGGAVYSPALQDFIIMAEGIGNMYITGPEVIKTVTGEVVDHETLGGAAAHASKSGVATLPQKMKSPLSKQFALFSATSPQITRKAPPPLNPRMTLTGWTQNWTQSFQPILP